LLDFLLPSTDGGVAVQLAIWFVLSTTALWFTRHNKDFRLLAIGLSVLTFGIMAVRAIH
jgi:ABC-type uncharacterized transport system permease subunit